MTTITFKKRSNYSFNQETGVFKETVDEFKMRESDQTEDDKERIINMVYRLTEDKDVFDIKVWPMFFGI